MNTFYTNFLSKMNIAFSLILGILYVFVIFLNYKSTKLSLIRHNKSYRKKILSNNHKARSHFHFSILHILIPLFIVTQSNVLFFTTVTIVIFSRFRIFYQHKKSIKGFLFYKLYIIELGWVFYHLIFFMFWLFDVTNI